MGFCPTDREQTLVQPQRKLTKSALPTLTQIAVKVGFESGLLVWANIAKQINAVGGRKLVAPCQTLATFHSGGLSQLGWTDLGKAAAPKACHQENAGAGEANNQPQPDADATKAKNKTQQI